MMTSMKAKYISILPIAIINFFSFTFDVTAGKMSRLSFFLSLSSFFYLRQNGRKPSFLTRRKIIRYSTEYPYAHAIRNNVIQVESSNVVDPNTTEVLLFNGTMPDRTTRMSMFLSESHLFMNVVESLSFKDDTTNSVVSTTITNNADHCLFERFLTINHVSAANSVTTTAMCSTKSPKSNSSNAVPMARPFDEFSSDVTSANALDEQSFGAIKSDKD